MARFSIIIVIKVKIQIYQVNKKIYVLMVVHAEKLSRKSPAAIACMQSVSYCLSLLICPSFTFYSSLIMLSFILCIRNFYILRNQESSFDEAWVTLTHKTRNNVFISVISKKKKTAKRTYYSCRFRKSGIGATVKYNVAYSLLILLRFSQLTKKNQG